MPYKLITMLFTSAVVLTPPAVAQQKAGAMPSGPVRAEVLVLGTYHMNNPGRDLFNVKADDVISSKRQAEIEAVMSVLEKFHPTRIAVEADFDNERVPQRYTDYLAGNYELTRNETEQIGFRLAKRLGHEKVYPVDADGEFPYPRVAKFAQVTGRMPALEALQQETGAQVEALNKFLSTHTVMETLLFMNSDNQVKHDMDFYFRLAQFSEPWDWAGPDLVADWFRRNMRIYGNIAGLVESPQERVLVLYGAGHLGWLQFAFDNNQYIRLRKLAEFVD